MLKPLLTLALSLLVAGAAIAVPAKRKPLVVKQADGTSLTVMLAGDEAFHYYQTLDGVPLAQRADGTYCYAQVADGVLRPGTMVAHNADSRPQAEADFVRSAASLPTQVRELAASRTAQRNALRAKAGATPRRAPQRVGDMQGVTGKHKGLVILVNFQDVQMNAQNTRQEFDDMMNKEGYTGNGNAGSVHDYFYAQSYGKFDLTFDVVGPVTVSHNMAYYGNNDIYGNDQRPQEMVEEACRLADDEVDFSVYDWDKDGKADQVFLIYAGYNEAQGASSSTIWPHEWQLSVAGVDLQLDGVTIDTYGCSSELTGTEGSKMDGIGTPCHEFSHCLGLPDLYDTNTSDGSSFGMNYWSLMDYGCYGGDGYTPVGYTSYERWASGWLEPVELSEGCAVKGMQAITDAPEAYVIYNDANHDEYYLLENRQQKGWDQAQMGHGMLVLHVDYDRTAWTSNQVNANANRQRCTIIPADNSLIGYYLDYYGEPNPGTLPGDPYPGTSGNTSLTDNTTPAAQLYRANTDGRKLMNKPITRISESEDGLISFTFMGGPVMPVPAQLPAKDVSPTGFTASWEAVPDAVSYTVEVREAGSELPSDNLTMAEDFAAWGPTLTSDSYSEIKDLDAHMAHTGWTGKRIYEGPARLKMGSSSEAGELLSPLCAAPASGNVTLRITDHQYNADSRRLVLSLVGDDGAELASEEVEMERKDITHIVNFEGVTADYRLRVAPAKRAWLKSLALYDGRFTQEDFDYEDNLADKAPAKAPARQVFDNITDTHLVVAGLTENGAYSWRVRAVGDASSSAWSALQDVQLGTASGIAQATLAGIDGDTPVTVLALDGRKLRTALYKDWAAGLPQGVYLLHTAQGTLKVVKP